MLVLIKRGRSKAGFCALSQAPLFNGLSYEH